MFGQKNLGQKFFGFWLNLWGKRSNLFGHKFFHSKLSLEINLFIFFNKWPYWVQYWVQYWGSILGSIFGSIFGFNIGFNIGSSI